MKQYLFDSIGAILFGISSVYLLEFVNHWFLVGCVAILSASLFILFAQSKKEVMALYLMYSVSLCLSRYFLASFDLVPAFYFLANVGLACVFILVLTRPGVKMNALRSLVALIYILFLINQPRAVFYLGLLMGLLIFVNMSLQANRSDFGKMRRWKSRKAHRNFQERIDARNRLTANLIVQSVCAEYNKLEKRQFSQKLPVL